MMKRLLSYLRDRVGAGEPARLAGGASFGYALGWAIVFLIVVEAVTGAALAAFYAPSTTDAWASVAYVQDHQPWGWLVRGIHHHGGGAIAIACGIHLLQTAISGAYRRPRELAWWVGLLLLVLMLAWAVTGYVLRWDQEGFWANQVEVGVIAGTPVVGDKLRAVALGGNDYGNLTLTRFYMLHIVAMPALVIGIIGLHIKLARRHGPTPSPRAVKQNIVAPRWPDQALRNLIVMAIAFAALAGYTVSQHGAELLAPADPSHAFDARPLWYFRWLYELRQIAGSAEEIAALVAPGIALGLLALLPMLERKAAPLSIGEAAPPLARRKLAVGIVVALGALVTGLTVRSAMRDVNNEGHQKALADGEKQATYARMLAEKYGVPVTGALDVYKTPPMWEVRSLYAERCKSCHTDGDKDRTGPLIGVGHGDRAWLKAFLKDPSGARFYAKTKLAQTEVAMKPVDTKPDDLEDLVEMLYAETGAPDVDAAKRDRGKKVFEKECTDCHTVTVGVAGSSGPNLAGLGSRDYYTSFISNSKAPVHMGTDGEMPRFDKELTMVQRDALAGYLVWLRTASQRDLDALGPLTLEDLKN